MSAPTIPELAESVCKCNLLVAEINHRLCHVRDMLQYYADNPSALSMMGPDSSSRQVADAEIHSLKQRLNQHEDILEAMAKDLHELKDADDGK